MNINPSQPLSDLDGEGLLTTVKHNGEDIQKPLTLGYVLKSSLLSTGPGDDTPQIEKMERFILAQGLTRAENDLVEDYELTAEQVVLLKKLVSQSWPILVFGTVASILEGKQ